MALYRAAYVPLADRGFPSSAAETDAADVRSWLADRECWLAETPLAANPSRAADGTDTDQISDPAGAIQVRERPEWPCPEVCRLAVRPARQRGGLGAKLLGHAEGVVADRGHDRVRLRSFTGHPFLLDWYAERGYDQVDLQKLDSRPFDVPVLERRL